MALDIVQPQIDCSTADEFVAALSPIGPYFQQTKLSEQWLYRGQGRDYPLVPAALRDDGKFASLTWRNVQEPGERMLAERDILIQFFEIADKRGLILPDDSQELRAQLGTLRSERGDNLVAKGYDGWRTIYHTLSLTALAQHYGVPTRMLDWTRDPLVAAYFAGESALRRVSRGDSAGPLVVWAFYFPHFGKQDAMLRATAPITVVTAPSATNPNLKAQQGVFTLVGPYYTEGTDGSFAPLEQTLQHEWATDTAGGSRLQKFTLAASEADRLLFLLAKMDITPSAIYPGYQSIVDDMRMQRQWDHFC